MGIFRARLRAWTMARSGVAQAADAPFFRMKVAIAPENRAPRMWFNAWQAASSTYLMFASVEVSGRVIFICVRGRVVSGRCCASSDDEVLSCGRSSSVKVAEAEANPTPATSRSLSACQGGWAACEHWNTQSRPPSASCVARAGGGRNMHRCVASDQGGGLASLTVKTGSSSIFLRVGASSADAYGVFGSGEINEFKESKYIDALSRP